MLNIDEQLKVIKRGVVDIVTEEDLIKKLKTGKPLNVKLGIDPTATEIHLGHTVALNKLRQFQNLGHKAILIIGDWTAMVGDPTGMMAERPNLDKSTVLKYISSYKQQAFKILDKNNLNIVYNSEWFNKISFEEILKLCSKFTLAQMLEHESFEKRYKDGKPLTLREMLYPIMQGYDSIVTKADIELGGTDQKFNVIAGRFLQREYGLEPQVGLFTPILTGLDGKNKMSKSLKNYIGINDKPEDMYGKVMSIHDELIIQYFELLTDVDAGKIVEIKKSISEGKNPMEYKKMLAYNIVEKYAGKKYAEFAQEHFHKTFSERNIPYNNYKYTWNFDREQISIADFLKKLKIVESNSDARRLVEQGGFYINDERVDDFKRIIKKSNIPFTFRAGKKNFGVFE